MATYQSTQLLRQKITTFSSWMEAWNVYLAVYTDHMPSQAPSLVAYQCIITSAKLMCYIPWNLCLVMMCNFEHWQHPTLSCDGIVVILIYGTSDYTENQTMALSSITHFPHCCPFRPYSSKQISNRQWNLDRQQSDSQFTENPTFNRGQSDSQFTPTSNKNPIPPNQNLGYCKDFNYTLCKQPYCKFSYYCQTCGSNYPARICPKAETSWASN